MSQSHQSYFEKASRDFKRWFLEKHHPHSVLNKTVFLHDLLKFVGLVLIFLILYNNIEVFNGINLWILKLGSIILLVLLYFIVRKGWHLCLNLKYWLRGLNNGTKTILWIILVLLILLIFINQDKFVTSSTDSYNKIDFNRLVPVNLGANYSLFNFGSLSKNLNLCPKINVSMKLNQNNYQWFSDDVGSISAKSYDGWSIKGPATCRKGSKEGENLNKYYCGGFTYILGIGSVNAYVEKTDVSKDGSIGKTYKHIIWNIYDENRNFVETRCLGDPDKFEEQQVEDFMNELRRWG